MEKLFTEHTQMQYKMNITTESTKLEAIQQRKKTLNSIRSSK